jgi:RNA polymerase sigma-70 factor (ECF subfamily)
MRHHNRRLYRVARAILRDDAEAEDVMQDAHVRAYQHLASFQGRSRFSTWLTRIAEHEALARVRKRMRFRSVETSEESNGDVMKAAESGDRGDRVGFQDPDAARINARGASRPQTG